MTSVVNLPFENTPEIQSSKQGTSHGSLWTGTRHHNINFLRCLAWALSQKKCLSLDAMRHSYVCVAREFCTVREITLLCNTKYFCGSRVHIARGGEGEKHCDCEPTRWFYTNFTFVHPMSWVSCTPGMVNLLLQSSWYVHTYIVHTCTQSHTHAGHTCYPPTTGDFLVRRKVPAQVTRHLATGRRTPQTHGMTVSDVG